MTITACTSALIYKYVKKWIEKNKKLMIYRKIKPST